MRRILRGIGHFLLAVVRESLLFITSILSNILSRLLGKLLGVGLLIGLLLYLVNPGILRHLPWVGSGAQIHSRGTIVQGIRGISKLATAEFKGSATTEAVNPGWFSEERVTLSTEGVIIAGIDLQMISEDNITLNGDEVTIHLPPASILSVDIHHIQLSTSIGILPGIDPALQPQAEQQGRIDLIQAACQSNILGKAEVEAQRALTDLLSLLDVGTIRYIQEPASARSGCSGT